MQYRKFGTLDYRVSALSFGCMRFPQLGDDPGNIDEKEAIKMLHHAVDQGVNYLDTAYPYHGGQSEILVGKAIKGGYREKVKLATKLPIWLVKEEGDFDKFLNEQLEKLGVETVDFYLIHALNKNLWKKAKDLNILESLDRAIKDGRIQYAGFSFHDELRIFKEIVAAYPWRLCQIHLNHVDRHYQAGLTGVRYAAEKGLAVIAMEPLRGGSLVTRVPEDIMGIWDTAQTKRSPVDWALRWLWNQAGVSTVLSGMSTMAQVEENIALASEPQVSLTQEELAIFDDVKRRYEEKSKVNCTGCGYCQPCDSKVAIPLILSRYNDVFMYAEAEAFSRFYQGLKEKNKDASQCSECGKCLDACPQQLPVTDVLREVEEYFQAGEKQ